MGRNVLKALISPVGEAGLTDRIKNSEKPLYLWGLTRAVRPLIAETVREKNRFVLLVTYDDARAEKLYQDYKFYDRNVSVYPAKDLLFYYADIHGNATACRRLEIIKRIVTNEPTVIITTIDGLMDKLPDIKYIKDRTITVEVGETLDMEAVKSLLIMLGYENETLVTAPGQFSVRGGIIDIFPLTEECPCRVELFGDEVESIRYFDVESQRSIEEVEKFSIFPATEYVLTEARISRGISRIEKDHEKRAAELKSTFKTEQYARLNDVVRHLKEDIQEFDSRSGIDSLINYFYSTTVSFLDYMPKDTAVFVDEPDRVAERADMYFREFAASIEGRFDGGYILPGQMDILYDNKRTLAELSLRNPILFSEFYSQKSDFDVKSNLQIMTRSIVSFNGAIDKLREEISKWRKNEFRVVIAAPSATRGRRLVESLNEDDIPAFFSLDRNRKLEKREVMVTTGNLVEGYEIPEIGLAVLSENDIFSKKNEKRRKLSKQYSGDRLNSLSDISVGDYVVHERHGIGVYKGIEQVEIDGRKRDYINIQYADNGKLFIPVEQLSMIGKFSGKDSRKPKLNKLGSPEWNKVTTRVRQQIDTVAEELVTLYAIRRKEKGYAFSEDTVWQKEFEELFPYDETPDQMKAIEDTKHDMESDRIMDRLICGDVGFGKTEVAIRAAFKAVQDGKQVAYLVPTTILAEQHYETFKERMKNYPVEVRMLSRFCTPKDIKKTISDLSKGIVDIVIGTHRLLSKDVQFKHLGLLIIDEEQRFGVKHKEAIKQMRNTVDVLTLTATPIPRTLHMSLIGVRDMSLLEEAPVDRRPIQTYVMEYDREIVREAINRELARNGQVYYVYNRVEDIDLMASELSAILPDAKIEFAHGKMPERELENVMHRFINKEIDILVSTTIIETGLDIPNVNTIIIHNADNFGLAQLYQLRGRVGRSGRNAYAFLLYKRDKMIKEVAEKRLSAIREFTELGSGYKISMTDLEIRGAGNILGKDQSGHLGDVGYDFYVKMLNEAIRTKLGENTKWKDFDTSIDLSVDAFIPDEYVRNEYLKLEMYKRVSRIDDQEDADIIIEEARDRYGEPPKAFLRLIRIAVLKAAAHSIGITDIKYQEEGFVQYLFTNDADIIIDKIPKFMKKYKNDIRLVNAKKSGFAIRTSKLIQDDMLTKIEAVIEDMRENLIGTVSSEKKD
ncbi:MAG: transcription-repair coupling factor [Eubacterium sp.]|nr:transcription-repair coupling factor [Eubacterium sp.]